MNAAGSDVILEQPVFEKQPFERRALTSYILSAITVTAAVGACLPLFSVIVMI